MPPMTPQMDPPKSFFWMAELVVPVFYDIRRYFTDKYYDIIWRYHAPEDPLKRTNKN